MKKIKNMVVKALRKIRKKEEPEVCDYNFLTSYYQELDYSMQIAKLLDNAKLEGINVRRLLAVTMAAVQMTEGFTEVEILNEKDLMLMELKEEA